MWCVFASAVIAVVVITNGCSNLRSTKRIDLAPFAEYTMTLAMEIEYGLTEASRTTHLRKYWNDPIIAEHRVEWNKVRALLKGVVAYSVEITTLGNSQLSGRERCQTLADYLEPLARPVVTNQAHAIRISSARMDSILIDIRKQKRLLDGIAAAQPIIDEVARVADNIFDEVKESLDYTAEALMHKIDENNADVVFYEELLRKRQYEIFRTAVLLTSYRTGDRTTLPELFELDPNFSSMSRRPIR